MRKTETTRYDVAEHLRTQEEMAAYLEACLEEASRRCSVCGQGAGGYRQSQRNDPSSPRCRSVQRKFVQGTFGRAQPRL